MNYTILQLETWKELQQISFNRLPENSHQMLNSSRKFYSVKELGVRNQLQKT